LPLHLALQLNRPGDLADDIGNPARGVQPLLGHPQASVTGRVPLSLHPPAPAVTSAVRLSFPRPRPAGEARSRTRIATVPASPSPAPVSSAAAGMTSHGTAGPTGIRGSRAEKVA